MNTKETHSINQVEELMYSLHERLIKAITPEERKAILKQLKPLQRHWNDVNDKHINGKKYPKRMPHLRDNVFGLTEKEKQEVLKLIDSVGVKH